ncbi:2-succinyl-6-hydroxy-2, 4-cyclohexadiene-1-carboxylate synthase [Vibrio mangrovi]|uniref:Putative 2-succinyl-6-hydroxy-2,4-cyclohexadiene-1-carboxylate synthase n=2 Tax=Vibrio mangrovi TaxID=474394 RepID=A0A1Y6IPT1_9VIBR|nr:2-succinyl-6-hydroxy-2,4-cyclohexadiene-1-carboxylate synthase [Vibrio mangrovi]MDW6003550.1 2-succinyl-6-hydroxy-2,4-cyclohexadiene-1-carboxylate synthase [Vibrio mangrovi]SMR99657.1 2-succinyl-6-hydroxy-2, 4-cyclohexadiene-1-carboxylate synthase [Vibrio mangrovi]
MSGLYSLYTSPENRTGQDLPVLVFLHGLLGSGEDWSETLTHLTAFPCLTIDLCGHGQSRQQRCTNFDDCCEQIARTIRKAVPAEQPLVLVGYSLGGRLAMYGAVHGHWAELNLTALVIEGGNFGLHSDVQRQQRWQQDQLWATRFASEPVADVLSDWYQQPVFSSLNHEQRQHLITRRSDNLGAEIAVMMRATSLARQPDLLPALKMQSVPVRYICGENDHKFRQLAQQSGLPVQIIFQAGHNVHQERPEDFARCLQALSAHQI